MCLIAKIKHKQQTARAINKQTKHRHRRTPAPTRHHYLFFCCKRQTQKAPASEERTKEKSGEQTPTPRNRNNHATPTHYAKLTPTNMFPKRVRLALLTLFAFFALFALAAHSTSIGAVSNVISRVEDNARTFQTEHLLPGESSMATALHILDYSPSTPFREIVALLYKSARTGNAEAQFYLGVLHTFGIGVVKSESKAITYYTMAALSGSPEAAVVLTNRYENGIGVPQDVHRAVEFAKLAATRVAKDYKIENRQRVPLTLLETTKQVAKKSPLHAALGMSVTDDNIIQSHVYRSEQGNLESKMTLGYTYLYGLYSQAVDVPKAMRHFEDALAKKHPQAYGALGQIYMQGLEGANPPIRSDQERAFRLFESGAELGDAVSMNGLGYFYARSATLRVSQNEQEDRFKKAAEYYSKAAGLGNADATYNLAVLKLHGKGAPKDTKGARTLLQIAAGKGSLLAGWQLGLLAMVSEPGVPRSDTVALRFFKDVADKGTWRQRLQVAQGAYRQGNERLALIEYLISSELALPTARPNALHVLHGARGLDTIDVIRHASDETAAERERLVFTQAEAQRLSQAEAVDELILTIILRSALEGDKSALLKLGDYYYNKGNYSRAMSCYEQASTGDGLAQAMFNLGFMYQNGMGTLGGKSDFSSAKRYFDAALERSQQTTDGDAYYAVQGALYVLNFHYWIEYFKNKEVIVGGGFSNFFSTDSFSSGTFKLWGLPWDDWLLYLSAIVSLILLLLRNQVA